MIESGIAWAGQSGSPPELTLSWGQSEDQTGLFYDLSSLTKIVITNTLLRDLAKSQCRSIHDFRKKNLGDFLKALPDDLARAEIALLWDHRLGLASHFRLDPSCSRKVFRGSRDELWNFVLRETLRQPRGKIFDTVYSDLSYFLLGALLESHYKKDLASLWQEFKKENSLPSNDLLYGPVEATRCVPTEIRHPAGEVNDDNAHFMQGCAPHAGLFSSVEALWEWLSLMSRFVDEDPEWSDYFCPQHEERFWCGWDRPTGTRSLAGEGASRQHVIGHLGYTGTALWWNPLTKWAGILLTNRVYPSAGQNESEIRDLRIKLFSVLWHNKRRELWKALQGELQAQQGTT